MGFNVCPLRGRETYNGIKLKSLSIIFTVIYVILSTPEVAARGRMMEPTQRSSLWLRGYDSPRNDDDTGLNCGGRWAQHGINNGKCGVCGDRYDVTPRPNEPGGTYANGIIANTYTTDDQSIHVVIDIQSFLGGYFEFRICPHNNPHTSVSQGCLDQHQLRVWDVMSNDEPKYQYIPKRVGLHRLRVEMPTGMTCTQCVLQWKWRTAKDWGKCPDGNARLGCGPQEEFYNCADISIEKATASNQRLTLPEVTLTNSNEPISFDNSALTFDQGNDFPNVPMSFLPQEVLQAGNIGPVVPPKFEFFDPSATSTHAQPEPTSQPEATTIVKDTVSTVDNSNSNSNVVELKFNGNNDLTTENNKQQSSTSVAADVTYQSTGSSSTAGNVDITVSSLVPNENSSTEPKPTVVAIVEKTSSTLSSEQTSTSGSTETTSGQADATSTASTESTSTAKQSVEAGGIAIPSFAMGDMNTGGMLVKVGMGASTAQPTQETPSVTSQANIPQESSTSNDVTTTTGKEAFNVENLAAIATLVRSTRPKVSVDKISRRKRQAGPPPPPPGSGAPPPPAPGPAGPDYAPKPQQQSAGTISFGGLIGDSFSRSGQTQHSFMSAQDFTQSMGGGGGLSNSIPGEALAEVSMTGGLDMTGYPPDMMLAPGPPGPGMDPMGGPLTESIFLDQTLPQGGGSLLDAPVDASPSSFIKPGIPRPPKQSSAELEAAIVGAPMLTSAVSDTQISTNAADLVGASYIPELSEGRSNQAETSTAARHGTMIVPVEFSKTTGGSKAEYLSGSKGTSMRETAADTRAEIRSATMSLARFGYQPTAEQVLSGNIGIHHPTENLDTTNLEPIGLGPNSVAGAAAPGILSAILGGQQTQVTDASLDPAVKKTREDLIRQLGEAMGVIGTSSNKGPSNVRSLISMDPSPAAPNPQEQQQIVNTGASQAQQIVDAQPGGMGISFDGGMFGGNSMMNMGMGMGMGPTLDPMTGGQVSGGGLDMFGGLGMDMQTMDLQSLFGAADAAVNNQPVALPQVGPQNMANSQSSLSNAVAAAQTQSQNQAQRQPQTPSDLIDIGMPGMTIEEMMTLLNMEQGGATGSTSGAAAPKQPSLSSAPSEPNVAGINMESAMLGETSSQSASAMSSTSSSSSSSSSALSSGPSSSMESMMFGTNSVNEKPSNSLIGLTAQSLSEMSTSNLEALLAEATGNAPTQERITNSASSSSVSSTGSSSSASSSALGPDALGPDALLTAPLDKLSTAELEALLNSNPAPEPTPSAVPITTSQASVDFGFAPEPTPAPAAPIESRETQMIKTALKRAVFDATGTEFDFSQMTQTEMNDMVQMFGGLQNLQQYMTPDMFAPEPVVEPVTPPPTPAPIVEQQPAVDPLAGNAAGMDTTNLDFATMQQFLNPTMFGADMANFGFGQQGTDLQSMMSALNPTGAPLNQQADTISLADLLSGNINMGQQSRQSSSMTVDQSSQTTGSMDMNFDQFAQLSGNMGQTSQATQTNEAQMTSSSSSSATSGSQASSASSQITGTENMIWDPVQMQWISPDGTLVKDTSAAVEQAVVQPATPDVSLVDQTQQQSIANEMGASSSSTGFTMETSMSGSMRSQPSGTGASTGTGSSTTSNISPIVGGLDTSMTVDSSSTSSVSVSSGGSIDTQTQGIASSSLSDLIPVGEQVSVQMTEKASPSTLNVDPSPTVSTAGSANVKSRVITTSSPVVESPRPPVGQPNTKEMILFTQEMKKKQELEMMLQRQRQELQRLEEQRIEQSRKMMAEKQRIEYEKQQLALRKQQMEVDALRQEQLRQRQMLEQQRKQLAEERMRIENQRLKELEMAKQKAIEEERRRIREEQQRLREIEMAKKQAAEMERRRIEAERRKNAQAELTRRRAAEAERLRIEEERKRLQEERMRQEAAAAAAAKAKAEAEAAAAAAAAAKAEIEAREAAAAAMVVGMDTGVVIDTNATGNGSQSFTPIGAVGGQLTDADAATAMAWQAVVKAAQIQATGGAADPNAMITQQQEQLMQHQNLMNAIQTGQGLSPEWIKILEQAAGVATTPAPTTPDPNLAAMAGMDPAALMQLLQGQAGQSSPPVTTPAPPTTTPKPKRKAPIRPDPNTRDFVRNMFIDNIKPGVDPLSILIGLTPEMLMKSGVNPLIANSADLARIVPAVERALGVSLKKIPVPTGPRGQPLTPQPTGFQMLNVRSDPGGVGGPADQRREFLMQQRMMGEMMTMLGLGPEPLEPGDPGYRGPGATPGRGGPAHGGGAVGGHSFGGAGEPLGGHSFGGAGEPMGGHSFGGAGDPMGGHSFGGGGGRGRARGGGMAGAQGGLSAQLEMLGL